MRARGSGWPLAMLAFFVGATLVSALGGPLLVGLLVGGLAAWLLPAVRRSPPWTPGGRAAWRARLGTLALLGRAGRTWWALLRMRGRRGAPAPGWTVDPSDAHDAARFEAAFAVRCEVVTPRLQVWHSTDTGRAYEVDARRAPASARPGDLGWLAFEGGRPHVRLDREHTRVLN